MTLKLDQAMLERDSAGWKRDLAMESIVRNFLEKLVNKDGPINLGLF